MRAKRLRIYKTLRTMPEALHNGLLNLKENTKLLFNKKETLTLKRMEILP